LPEDWIHGETGRNLDDSALAPYLTSGSSSGGAPNRTVNPDYFRCPSDDPITRGADAGR
jgi:hypothetical protein